MSALTLFGDPITPDRRPSAPAEFPAVVALPRYGAVKLGTFATRERARSAVLIFIRVVGSTDRPGEAVRALVRAGLVPGVCAVLPKGVRPVRRRRGVGPVRYRGRARVGGVVVRTPRERPYRCPWACRLALAEAVRLERGRQAHPRRHGLGRGSVVFDPLRGLRIAGLRSDAHRSRYPYVRRVLGRAWQARPWVGGVGGVNLGLFTEDEHGSMDLAEWAAHRAARSFVRVYRGDIPAAVAELQRLGLIPAGVLPPWVERQGDGYVARRRVRGGGVVVTPVCPTAAEAFRRVRELARAAGLTPSA